MEVGGQGHARAALTLGESLGSHCVGGWVGIGAGLDKRGKTRPNRKMNPITSNP